MENGKIMKKMVKEYFINKKENIKECFYKENFMEMEYYIMDNLMYIKDNSNKIKDMEKVRLFYIIMQFLLIQGNSMKIIFMDMDNLSTLMVTNLLVIS